MTDGFSSGRSARAQDLRRRYHADPGVTQHWWIKGWGQINLAPVQEVICVQIFTFRSSIKSPPVVNISRCLQSQQPRLQNHLQKCLSVHLSRCTLHLVPRIKPFLSCGPTRGFFLPQAVKYCELSKVQPF